MEDNRKFYVTPNWIMDADIIGEIRYHLAGSCPDSEFYRRAGQTQEPIKESELRIGFKDLFRSPITVRGEDADKAWKNFRKVVGLCREQIEDSLTSDSKPLNVEEEK